VWVTYMESHFTVLFSIERNITKKIFDLYFYDQLGNQGEQYRITVDTTRSKDTDEDDDLVPPLEDTIATKWSPCVCDWNGSEPLL
jgi:hypothetical protein